MTDSHLHYYPLVDAPINTRLQLIDIHGTQLTQWFAHLGLFAGSSIVRHDEDFHYHPLRVKGDNGAVVIPSGFGVKSIVHIDKSDIRKPITEMEKGEVGHVETIGGGPGLHNAMKKLGLAVESEVTFMHDLPHMDYVTIINHSHRTRLSEGEAAKLWGKYNDGNEGQFYFSRKEQEFIVTEILGGPRQRKHLEIHGIKVGDTLMMETVQQAQSLHKPEAAPIVVSSAEGLRFYLSPGKAERIIVQTAPSS